MARIRTINPEFVESESIGKLSRDARLLFVLLWTFVDDAGRARASSRLLASRLYPYDEDATALIDAWMTELEEGGHVRRYEVDGDAYLDIPKWLKHQKIDHASASRLPEFREGLAKPRETLAPHTLDLGPSTKDLGPSGADAPSREKKSRKKPSVPIADDWVPDSKGVEYAKAQGLTEKEASREAERFRNNARQNDRRCADWPAAWRNWVLKSSEFLGRAPPPSDAPSSVELPGFYAAFDSPELVAWEQYERAIGKSTPRDKHGGWRFETQWPPGHQSAAA